MLRQSKLPLLAYLCFAIFQIAPLWASTYGPGLLFHKKYDPKPYEANFYMSFTAGQTDEAYNKNGQAVPFLQEYGNEDLLRQFINPSLDPTNIESLGKLNLSGHFTFQQLNLYYYKGIHHNLFIAAGTTIQNIGINSIAMDFELNNTVLTPEELFNLEIFRSEIPTSINKSGVFNNSIDIGYNNIFTNFNNIDFLHLFVKGTFSTPQWMTGYNFTMLQYPLAGNITFSYPITAIISIGILERISLGFYSLMIPFQSTDISIPVNRTESNNQILLREVTRVRINPKPLFSTVGYVEFYNFLPSKCMATIGYGYAYGMEWSLFSYNEREFPSEKINNSEILSSWSISSMFFQFDYDFETEERPQAPCASFMFIMPIAGNLYPKMNIIAGVCNFNITYNF
ncbi:MAG: hypothetical protein Q8Q60_01920 [Candidatus Chromulinivorax sp.]|nr:hypothetical protein [Candidatus Chromulinivorax sp.]